MLNSQGDHTKSGPANKVAEQEKSSKAHARMAKIDAEEADRKEKLLDRLEQDHKRGINIFPYLK